MNVVASLGTLPKRRECLAILFRNTATGYAGGETGTEQAIPPISAQRVLPSLRGMTLKQPRQRVEVSFVGTPPVQRVERASGVSDVEVDGSVLRCLVNGSFQPFLEALRGYEVVSLQSISEPKE